MPGAWYLSMMWTGTCSDVQRLGEVGTGLRGLGTSMFTGTRELLETVTDAISSELDSIEGMAARNKPRPSQSADRCGVAPQTLRSQGQPGSENLHYRHVAAFLIVSGDHYLCIGPPDECMVALIGLQPGLVKREGQHASILQA